MRNDILTLAKSQTPDHAGLAYDVWAPFLPVEKDDAARSDWLARVAQIPVCPDYGAAFTRWQDSFLADGSAVVLGRSSSRLLVGHGNPSPTEVGLTLHRTWGVPVIPGSALKGLTAHYVEAAYGPDDGGLDGERGPYRGAIHDEKGRLVSGPGNVYRALFGAPPAPDDERRGTREERGFVEFHDALPVFATGLRPLARDVLTVHQQTYYQTGGRGEAGEEEPWPNDYEDPIPVGFLAVNAGIDFLFAVSGPENWAALALRFLKEALERWGVGGKTAAGYGRFRFDVDQTKLDAQRRNLRDARIAHLSPVERWRHLSGLLKESQLLHLVMLASRPSENLIDQFCWEAEGWGAMSDKGREGLRNAKLDDTKERKAFREILTEEEYVAAWNRGRTKTGERMNMGKDKLKDRARLILGWAS